jgi:type IV pilus assembly protein PilY1
MTGTPAKEEIMRNELRIPNPSRPIRLLLAVTFLLLPATGAFAQACEIPLFVKQGLNGANVMILADNSGSMNAPILHDDYNPDVVYAGNFTGTTEYYVTRTKSYTPRSFRSTWASTPSANLVASDNGEDGRYMGNYLNWIFFHATAAQRAALPQQTRIQLLKAVLSDLIFRSGRLDFGLTVFQNDHGGSIIGKCGVNHTSLLAQIAGITANAWTPLGEATETILNYFAGSGPNAPISVPCQYNFLIVVTDGMPTMDLNVSGYLQDADGDGLDPGNCTTMETGYPNSFDCSHYFDDVVWYMQNRDLRPDLEGDQNIVTYVVGFNIVHPFLEGAARKGDGVYYRANNATELRTALEFAVQDILRRISAGSAVAVVSTEQGTDDRLYRGKFMPIDWDGFMECYRLPYHDGDAAIWEAGELLRQRSSDSRSIFTAIGGSVLGFSVSNASNLRTRLGAASDAAAADLISWGRGNDVNGLRNRRGWILGPIVHSTPVVVGPPANFLIEESYQDFFNANENRRKMVYVGANDGMLHAFDANSGEERWAFVPEFALPVFATMADSFYCHKYSVDQTVTVKDMKIGGSWRTVLASGGRQGGAAIFAMDVTDPNNPRLLWQNTLPNNMTFTSEVELVTIGGEAVALVGSGLDRTYMESWVHGYRVADGSLLGSRMLSRNSRAVRNKSTRPVSLDVNLDDSIDYVYAADLLGSVYRFDTRGMADPDDWTMSKLYNGTVEITANPSVAYGPNDHIYVYFGTGAYLEDQDMMTTAPQRFICVIDKRDGSTATISNLRNQTSSVSVIGNAAGWYLNLAQLTGERVTQPAVVVAETVIFTSFAPDQDACVAGGTSFLYQMRYDNGGKTDEQENLGDRVTELGQGIASYPVVDLSSGTVVVQSSDARISVEPIAAQFQRMNVRSWQESFDHVVQPAAAEVQ